MKRAAANLAAGLALLLAVAVPVLWVRSHQRADWTSGTFRGDRYLEIVSAEGGIWVRMASRYPWRQRFEWHTSQTYRPAPGPWYALGFAFRRDVIRFMPLHTGPPTTPPAPYWMVRVPYWFLLVFFATFPATRARAARRERIARRRRQQGLCVDCGYDVRASAERCPECGAAIPGPVTAS